MPNGIDFICEDWWRYKRATIRPKTSVPGGPSACGSFYLRKHCTQFGQPQGQPEGPLIVCELAMPPSTPSWAEIKVSFTLRFSYQSPQVSSINQTEGVNLQPGLFFSDILQLKMVSEVKNQLWESAQVKWRAACRQPAGTERKTVRNYSGKIIYLPGLCKIEGKWKKGFFDKLAKTMDLSLF